MNGLAAFEPCSRLSHRYGLHPRAVTALQAAPPFAVPRLAALAAVPSLVSSSSGNAPTLPDSAAPAAVPSLVGVWGLAEASRGEAPRCQVRLSGAAGHCAARAFVLAGGLQKQP